MTPTNRMPSGVRRMTAEPGGRSIYTIHCDSCGTVFSWIYDPFDPVKRALRYEMDGFDRARQAARASGWEIAPELKCPNCAKEKTI